MQDLQQTIAQLLDYVRGIWLKKRYIIISSWLICPIGFFYVFTLPDVYESKAVVYVDTSSVMESLLKGLTVEANPTEKIEIMTKTLLSRSNVEQIALKSDLDLTTTSDTNFNSLIDELSDDIKLSGTSKDNIFSIRYQSGSPSMAQKVVQETLNTMIEGTLGSNRKESDAADRFIESQIADYEARLVESESRLASFKRQYNDVLPIAGSFYTQLQELKATLESDRLSIAQLKEQIAAVKSKMARPKSNNGSVSANEESSLRTRYDDRIAALEEELDRLTLRFTDQHPDVVETKALLSQLVKSRDEEIEEFLAGYEDDDGSFNEINQDIQLEVSKLEGLLASTKVKEKATVVKIEELESKIDLIPQIEAELTALNRDYDVTKTKYLELLNRKETADLSRRAEVSAEELKFRVIEPPSLPLLPSNTIRPVFLTAVLVIGFGVGTAFAFLLSQMSPMLFRAEQLQSEIPYPIIGIVTHLGKSEIMKKRKKKVIVFVLSSSLLVLTYVTLVLIDLLQIDVRGVLQ
ncbi:chain-length determining protein [Alteromonas mediterranea]|uniref:XrtA system polysaccharide chain length determinant n=1 Tax=Alteromonas mediterranea TaxID=314275 RepID=UPI0009043EBD|nr:XrtA system polysaccharide chain length determinant [Alteromonas mediterranea]APE02674.1 chain-length determining protein [Alteromonas mediterranea]